MKFCPKCGSAIIPGTNNCQNCGEIINNVVQGTVSNNVVSPQAPANPLPVEPVIQAIPPVAKTPVPEVVPVVEPALVVEPNPVVAPSVTMPTQAMPPVNQVPVAPSPMMPQQAPVQNVQEVTVVVPPIEPVAVVENKPVMETPTPIVEETPKTISLESVQVPDKKEEVKPEEKIPEPSKSEKEKKVLTPEEKEKKTNRIITIIIIVISVLAMLVTTIFLLKAFTKKESSNVDTIATSTQYSYEGFEFFLPTGVLGSVEEGNFVIRDAENTWSAVITIQDGTYNSLVSNKSQISGYFETFGYISETAEEKEVSGISFVTTEVLMGSKNVLVAYAKASGTKVYGVIYTNKLGTYDNYSLKVVGEVLASAINSGYDTAIPEGFTIDMFEETFEVAK